ncbi:MAG: response regulator [Candidatus Hydrogenedentes bacterium]|nr:response regulator [Candidatus Hydrogenedentota bacterium]
MKDPVHLLLVEDDDIDAMAVKRALREYRVANPLTLARDGLEALEFLRGNGKRKAIPRPNLVLLDINMPRMNGLEFLQALRDDPDLSDTVVFVLTTSSREEDVTAAYRKNIAGYMTKQNAGKDFLSLFNMLSEYWRIVIFPP